MAKTIAQFTLTGITDVPLGELKEKMTLQDFEEISLVLRNRFGVEITVEVEDIQLIEAEEL